MNRLKEICEEFEMTTYDFNDLGYSKNVISNIQCGRSFVDEEKLVTLSNFFQVTTDYFLGLTNDGIYVDVLGHKYVLTKEKFLLYRSIGKIIYHNKKRTLDIHSLDEIKFVNSKVPSVELIDEI